MFTQSRIIAALIALAVWAASLALVGFKSYGLGVDHSRAKQADIEAARQQAREVPVYRDCRNDAGVLDNINSALRGESAGGGLVPRSASAPK